MHKHATHLNGAVTQPATPETSDREPEMLPSPRLLHKALTHPDPTTLTPSVIRRLQSTHGNAFVQRLVTQQRSVPVIQRTVWEAIETENGLEWDTAYSDETGTPPAHAPSAEGEVYDDETLDTYTSLAEYEAPSSEMVLDPINELKEEMDDDDYVDSEQEDDETSMDDTTPLPVNPGTEMTLDERKDVEDKSLAMPFSTSTLAPSKRNYPRKSLVTFDKLKRKGQTTIEQRSAPYGPVTIILETIELWVNDKPIEYVRPVEISGMVEPTSTKGREGAPDPLSGVQIYMGNKGQLKESIPMERNMGKSDMERGHIMALELGGPDIPENIVPQWAKFQGADRWRKMETSVLEQAENAQKHKQMIKYKVTVYYKETGEITPTMNSFGVPTGFRATVHFHDATGVAVGGEMEVFNSGQAQDVTDRKLYEREGGTLEKDIWDPALNVKDDKKKRSNVKTGTVQKGKKTSAKKAQIKKAENAQKKKAAHIKKKRNS
jgi:hypothetical protein